MVKIRSNFLVKQEQTCCRNIITKMQSIDADNHGTVLSFWDSQTTELWTMICVLQTVTSPEETKWKRGVTLVYRVRLLLTQPEYLLLWGHLRPSPGSLWALSVTISWSQQRPPHRDLNTHSQVRRLKRLKRPYRETVSNSIFPAWGVLGFSNLVEKASKLLKIQILISEKDLPRTTFSALPWCLWKTFAPTLCDDDDDWSW